MQNGLPHQKQRLAIFLDGTWNTQDDSTNILHAHALMVEGMSKDGFIQKRYYDRGVGTGMFESVLGGGFGVGLEVNVREAYNWLVDHYNDGDEIYIFGFSRGAYSARSLVGFIAFCGLIKRGAPLTNSQLWDGYVKISRARGGQKTLLEKIGPAIEPPFRKIKSIRKNKGKNNTENLLKEWSRRVKITYLGIFDTVGAMGLEALGIKGLRSRSGLNHNQNPTKLIQKCRHALAIDENRSSFRLTPFLHYISNADDKEEIEANGYRNNISQKWFIGAHSNIGGGYNDNLLAYFPLKWVLDGAKAEGLKTRDLSPSIFPAKINQVNDSYLDFTGIVWPHIFREKRHYRQINQSEIIVAGVYGKRDKETGKSKPKKRGFTLVPIYEEIDQSVVDLIEATDDESYIPPNLKNYANRITVEEIQGKELSKKEKVDLKIKALLANRNPKDKWLGNTALARIILVCWSTLAAIGIAFLLNHLLIKAPFLNWKVMAAIALIFTISDFGEFHFNFKTGLNPSNIISKVSLNVLMWIRFLGIMAFFFGTIAFTLKCIDWGWSQTMGINEIIELVKEKKWYLIPFFPMLAVLILDFLYNELERKEGKTNIKVVVTRIGATIFSPIVFLIFGFTVTYFSGFLIGFSMDEITPTSNSNLITRGLAGQLLIIQFLFLVLNYIFIWVGKPTRRAKLGFAITGLQKAYKPEKIKELFDVMKYNISQAWVPKTDNSNWENVKKLVRESLWRDVLGFIPAYTLVFGTTMWLASTYGHHENWNWLSEDKIMGIPIWILIILVTALADYSENFIHLKHIKNYNPNKSSYGLPHPYPTFPKSERKKVEVKTEYFRYAFLTAVGFLFTIIKTIGFFTALILSTLIFINYSIEILIAEPGGWQWLTAVSITLFILYILGSLLLMFVKKKLSPKN
ncbi:MAG: DUF2235 domain-containing protein [Saprospiraceae bacterium]